MPLAVHDIPAPSQPAEQNRRRTDASGRAGEPPAEGLGRQPAEFVVVADTTVLYALADRRDEHHAGCAGWFCGDDEVLLVPATVAAKTCYRIGWYPGPAAQAASRTARAAAGITRSGWPDRPAPTFTAWLSSCDATPAGTREGPALV